MTKRIPSKFVSRLRTLEIGGFEALTERLRALERGMGRTSGALMERRMKEILDVCPDVTSIALVLRTRGYIRAMARLWIQQGTDVVPRHVRILQRLDVLGTSSANNRLGRLALRELRDLFFLRYDPEDAFFQELGKLIRLHLTKYRDNEISQGLDGLKDNSTLLDTDGHTVLAGMAALLQRPLPELAKDLGIPVEGQFFSMAAWQRYIVPIQRMSPNAESPLFRELLLPEVHRAPLSRTSLVGHMVLAVMMDKLILANEDPSDQWRDFFLAVAGDPRVPRTHENYTLWWSHLGEKRMRAMLGWLSKVDLELFLSILKEYARTSGSDDLKRMFPLRAHVLRSLVQKKLVKSTRLFLSRKPADYVDDVLRRKGAEIAYTSIESSPGNDLSVMYLNLGVAHMVEGTHNFRLHIFDRLPPNSVLQSYEESVSRRDISTGLRESYEQAFPSSGRALFKVHRGDWNYQAVEMLWMLGVHISEKEITEIAYPPTNTDRQ